MKKINVARTFGFMFVAVMLTKVLGLLRNIIFAGVYGDAPAFLAAQNIPLTLFDISLGAAVISAFIPIFAKTAETDGQEKAMRFTNSFTNFIILVSASISLLGMLLAPFVIKLGASGLTGQDYQLAVFYIRILFPIIIITAVTFVFVGVLQSLNQFKIPAIVSLVSSLILIIYLLVFNNKFGMNGYIVVMLLAWLSQVIIQLPSLIKSGYRFIPEINFKDGKIKQIGLLALPILLSTWEQPINSLININLGSHIANGVSALYYSNQFYLIAVGGFSMAVVNLIFPSLSRSSLLEDKTQFKNLTRKAMKVTLYVVFPLTAGFIILSRDIITLVYERGKFDAVLAHDTSAALMFYSIGMVGYGIQEICRKAFYSSDKAKIPMVIACITITANLILSITLSGVMGVGGIALAAAVASTTGAVLQVIMVNRINKGIISDSFIKDMFKIIAISVIMGLIVYILRNSLENISIVSPFVSKAMVLGICGVAGAAVYFVLTFILRVEEAVMGMRMIKAKFLG